MALLSTTDSLCFLWEVVSSTPIDFFSPIHLCNFSNLCNWNTAWLVSLEDLPITTLTHKYLLSSQCFDRRPSVFVLHIPFCKIEWADLTLLFVVLLRFSNRNFEVKRLFHYLEFLTDLCCMRYENGSMLRWTTFFFFVDLCWGFRLLWFNVIFVMCLCELKGS